MNGRGLLYRSDTNSQSDDRNSRIRPAPISVPKNPYNIEVVKQSITPKSLKHFQSKNILLEMTQKQHTSRKPLSTKQLHNPMSFPTRKTPFQTPKTAVLTGKRASFTLQNGRFRTPKHGISQRNGRHFAGQSAVFLSQIHIILHP